MGRNYFTHEDVQAVVPLVLGHRLIVRPEAELEGKRIGDIVSDLLSAVTVVASCIMEMCMLLGLTC